MDTAALDRVGEQLDTFVGEVFSSLPRKDQREKAGLYARGLMLDEDALRIANDTPFGLAGGVWTQNLATAHKVSRGINAGTVWVNCYGVLDPAVGFGGTKMSGYGWKGAKEHVESYLYPKAVYINLG
jgi:hypothetical protein